MKIETKKLITNLKGEPYKDGADDLTLGMVLGNVLTVVKEEGRMKIFILAKNLYESKKTVEVDAADLAFIKKAVKESTVYNNIILGQAEYLLEEAK